MMKLEDIPDLKSNRFPKKLNVAVTAEDYNRYCALKAKGKDPAEFVRMLISKALAEVFEEKKAG